MRDTCDNCSYPCDSLVECGAPLVDGSLCPDLSCCVCEETTPLCAVCEREVNG